MNIEGLVLVLMSIDDPMKTVHSLILTSLIALFLSSCTKESFEEKIVGKWQIQEVYNGYANGGNFQWTAVPDQYRSVMEFHDNGTFAESSGRYCTGGTYTVINDDQIQINSNCFVEPFILYVNLSKKELTITHPVREGEVKEKFIRL